MNTLDDLYMQIHSLLKSHGDLQPREDLKSFNYVHDSSLDSFELFSFIVDVESVFCIQFTPDELTQSDMHTVGGLASLIATKLQKAG